MDTHTQDAQPTVGDPQRLGLVDLDLVSDVDADVPVCVCARQGGRAGERAGACVHASTPVRA